MAITDMIVWHCFSTVLNCKKIIVNVYSIYLIFWRLMSPNLKLPNHTAIIPKSIVFFSLLCFRWCIDIDHLQGMGQKYWTRLHGTSWYSAFWAHDWLKRHNRSDSNSAVSPRITTKQISRITTTVARGQAGSTRTA